MGGQCHRRTDLAWLDLLESRPLKAYSPIAHGSSVQVPVSKDDFWEVS